MPTASSYSKNRQEPPIQPLFIGLNPKPSRMRWLLINIDKKSSDFLVGIIQPFFFFRNSWIFLIDYVFSQWCLHFFARKRRWQRNYSKIILIIHLSGRNSPSIPENSAVIYFFLTNFWRISHLLKIIHFFVVKSRWQLFFMNYLDNSNQKNRWLCLLPLHISLVFCFYLLFFTVS